jgi:hypothetical protein
MKIKKEEKEELLYGKTTKSSKGQAMLTLKGLKLPFLTYKVYRIVTE